MKRALRSGYGKARNDMKEWASILVVLSVMVLIVSGIAQAEQKKMISIGTGGTGGIYYPYGGAIAKEI